MSYLFQEYTTIHDNKRMNTLKLKLKLKLKFSFVFIFIFLFWFQTIEFIL